MYHNYIYMYHLIYIIYHISYHIPLPMYNTMSDNIDITILPGFLLPCVQAPGFAGCPGMPRV